MSGKTNSKGGVRQGELVQVKDITYNEGIVEYHLGLVLEKINNNK